MLSPGNAATLGQADALLSRAADDADAKAAGLASSMLRGTWFGPDDSTVSAAESDAYATRNGLATFRAKVAGWATSPDLVSGDAVLDLLRSARAWADLSQLEAAVSASSAGTIIGGTLKDTVNDAAALAKKTAAWAAWVVPLAAVAVLLVYVGGLSGRLRGGR